MDEPEPTSSPSTWSRLRAWIAPALIGVVALGAASAALNEPDLPPFEAVGPPLPLPEGPVAPIDQRTFEQVLVGQRGQVVVVNLWASWCAPCRTEMPVLQRASDTFAGEALILGVATNDDQERARVFLEDLGITYPNVFDASGDIQEVLDLTAFPTTYVFDAEGTLRSRVDGGISEQRLAGLIEDALP